MVSAMRSQVLQRRADLVPRAHQTLQNNLQQKGNIYGQQLPCWEAFRKERAEYLFFVGCVFTYTEPESAQWTMRLLQHLGVDFTTIDERCCGGPSSVVGQPRLQELAAHNRAQIEAVGARKVITSCPRCYLTLKNEPAYAGLEVWHTTQFLSRVSNLSSHISLSGLGTRRLTYHDPCELGRMSGEYEAARQVIRSLGAEFVAFSPEMRTLHSRTAGSEPSSRGRVEFVELSASRELSECCGAGGGVRGAFPHLSIQIARARLLAAQFRADVLLTECPSCLHNFRNARRSQDTIEVYNLSEWIGRHVATD